MQLVKILHTYTHTEARPSKSGKLKEWALVCIACVQSLPVLSKQDDRRRRRLLPFLLLLFLLAMKADNRCPRRKTSIEKK